jgi:anthranilate/para-aminobenzoate synthase component II
MKKIGVTQRIITLNESDTYDALENNLFKYFRKLGFELVPIPNFYGLLEDDQELYDWLDENKIKRFLLSGGGDPHKLDERYYLEKRILDFSKTTLLPVFGICRGLERMLLHEGGELIEIRGHVNKEIEFSGEVSGKFKCFHDLSISKLPKMFQILSVSPDKYIEAIKHSTFAWEACMWHPERSVETNVSFEHRLKEFFGNND